jgi:hypothetical protein
MDHMAVHWWGSHPAFGPVWLAGLRLVRPCCMGQQCRCCSNDAAAAAVYTWGHPWATAHHRHGNDGPRQLRRAVLVDGDSPPPSSSSVWQRTPTSDT